MANLSTREMLVIYYKTSPDFLVPLTILPKTDMFWTEMEAIMVDEHQASPFPFSLEEIRWWGLVVEVNGRPSPFLKKRTRRVNLDRQPGESKAKLLDVFEPEDLLTWRVDDLEFDPKKVYLGFHSEKGVVKANIPVKIRETSAEREVVFINLDEILKAGGEIILQADADKAKLYWQVSRDESSHCALKVVCKAEAA